MKFRCPECSKKYWIDDIFIPEYSFTVVCSHCRTEFAVDNPLLIDKIVAKFEESSNKDLSQYKECPFCKEKIRSGALKCRYCGEFFPEITDYEFLDQEHDIDDNKISTSGDECEYIDSNELLYDEPPLRSTKYDKLSEVSISTSRRVTRPSGSLGKDDDKLQSNTGFPHKVKIGGWLAFFCIVLVFLCPFFSLCKMLIDWNNAQAFFKHFPAIKTAAIFEYTGISIILLFGFFIGITILCGNPQGPKLARSYLLIRLIGFISFEFIAFQMINRLPSKIVSLWWSEVTKILLVEAAFFLVWWLYFKFSKRVKNTYDCPAGLHLPSIQSR
jgi:hypothetical protein